jgi:hypothetical protein
VNDTHGGRFSIPDRVLPRRGRRDPQDLPVTGSVITALPNLRVVQPKGFLRRLQLISVEEALEHQVALVPQIRHTTIGHPHRGRNLTASHSDPWP